MNDEKKEKSKGEILMSGKKAVEIAEDEEIMCPICEGNLMRKVVSIERIGDKVILILDCKHQLPIWKNKVMR